jgi:hypothetical protein
MDLWCILLYIYIYQVYVFPEYTECFWLFQLIYLFLHFSLAWTFCWTYWRSEVPNQDGANLSVWVYTSGNTTFIRWEARMKNSSAQLGLHCPPPVMKLTLAWVSWFNLWQKNLHINSSLVDFSFPCFHFFLQENTY